MVAAPAQTLPPSLLTSLEERLVRALDFRLAAVAELEAPVIHNNRLFRLEAHDGRAALLKLYQRDDRRRLEREYDALSFLRARGFTTVPSPHLRDDARYYAVYSFEPGANKPAAQWTERDAAAAGQFAADLHRIAPQTPGADFPPAFSGTFSYAEMLAGLRRRLTIFRGYVASAPSDGTLPPAIRELLDMLDPTAEVERLVTLALRGLSPEEIESRVPREHHRLNTNDFAPHNILIRPQGHPDGYLCVVDHEYFGWDETAALIAGFLTAEQALDLPPSAQRAFLETYRAAGVAPPGTFERLERVGLLMHLAWCGVHMALITPDGIARKRFATPRLDVDAMLTDQIAKLHRRLAIARKSVAALA